AELFEERRVGQPVRLVQAVMEGGGEETRVAGGDRGAEERGLRGGGGGFAVRELVREPLARLERVDALCGDDDHRREREVGCDARRVRAGAVAADQAGAAAPRRREVVGGALGRQAE